MLACEGGHVEVVRSLLAAGAPWNELDVDNHCAGEWASASGHAELAQALIEHAVQAELVLGVVGRRDREPDLSYLATPVRYDGDDKLLDENNDAVMMSWEAPLMREHARVICATKGDVLNVGFGMGIIDGYIADENVTRSHTIIEAHPDVHAHMRRVGWHARENVRVECGRWQTVLSAIADANDALPGGVTNENARLFDGVFFDTYGEEWDDMREFHALLPRVMRPGGVYSYFNGLAPDNIFFHTVYCQLAAKELARLGFETAFDVVPIDTKSAEIWKGVKRRYWWGHILPAHVRARRGDRGGLRRGGHDANKKPRMSTPRVYLVVPRTAYCNADRRTPKCAYYKSSLFRSCAAHRAARAACPRDGRVATSPRRWTTRTPRRSRAWPRGSGRPRVRRARFRFPGDRHRPRRPAAPRTFPRSRPRGWTARRACGV